jgi:predicted membrane protein
LPTPVSEQKQLYRVNRVAFAGIGIVAALMTIGFLFWRPNTYARASLSLLIGTQAVLVFGAFVGNGQPRYVMGMWPALVAAQLLGFAALLVYLHQLRQHPAPASDAPAGLTG